MFKFYSSVASQQQVVTESGEKVLGSLMLSVCYRRDKTAVEVNLIQGSGLPGLDHTGEVGGGGGGVTSLLVSLLSFLSFLSVEFCFGSSWCVCDAVLCCCLILSNVVGQSAIDSCV